MTRLALLGLLVGVIAHANFVDPDLYHGMAWFREALRLGRIPLEDTFAYTPTVYPVVHHEWGHGALLYGLTVASGLGATGLILLKYTLVTAVAVGCYICARRRGASEGGVAYATLVALGLVQIGFTTVRAQVVTLTLLVALMLLLEVDRRGRKWWIPVWLGLYLLWLNMHAGFVVGAAVFGLHTVERLVRRTFETRSVWGSLRDTRHLLIVGAAMSVLVSANPYGWHYVAYLWRALRLDRALVLEWQPLWETQSPTSVMSIAFGISVALALYAAARRGVGALHGLALVLLAAFLALRHTRHVPLYGVMWLCLVPGYIAGTRLGSAIAATWRNYPRQLLAIWAAIGVVGWTSAFQQRFWEVRMPTATGEGHQSEFLAYPAGAVAYLEKTRFRGNLYVFFRNGAYVSWHLHPAVKVSIDGRYEAAYPEGALEESWSVYDGLANWQGVLARYGTDALLVRRSKGLGKQLEGATATGPWRRVYIDDAYSVYMQGDLARTRPRVDRRGQVIAAAFP